MEDGRPDYLRACQLDAAGREVEAVPFYERALAGLLPADERRDALLCLGSTLRALGRYDEALARLEEGRREFPGHRAYEPFLALTLHNLGRHAEAVELLLTVIAETTGDESIARYERALLFYAGQPGETWDEPKDT